jgi:phosphoribosylformylglycinamidine (FGAM) synthase-like enzyme
MDAKQPGNILALVGMTRNELGGSHFALVHGLSGGAVPRVDIELAPRLFRALHRAILAQCVPSCHDLSEGGLAAAAAEMAFAGELGLELDLKPLADRTGIAEDAVLLFSESNSRFLVEVSPQSWSQFAACFEGLPLVQLGKVTGGASVTVRGVAGSTLVDSSWADLKQSWKSPLAWQ